MSVFGGTPAESRCRARGLNRCTQTRVEPWRAQPRPQGVAHGAPAPSARLVHALGDPIVLHVGPVWPKVRPAVPGKRSRQGETAGGGPAHTALPATPGPRGWPKWRQSPTPPPNTHPTSQYAPQEPPGGDMDGRGCKVRREHLVHVEICFGNVAGAVECPACSIMARPPGPQPCIHPPTRKGGVPSSQPGMHLAPQAHLAAPARATPAFSSPSRRA